MASLTNPAELWPRYAYPTSPRRRCGGQGAAPACLARPGVQGEGSMYGHVRGCLFATSPDERLQSSHSPLPPHRPMFFRPYSPECGAAGEAPADSEAAGLVWGGGGENSLESSLLATESIEQAQSAVSRCGGLL